MCSAQKPRLRLQDDDGPNFGALSRPLSGRRLKRLRRFCRICQAARRAGPSRSVDMRRFDVSGSQDVEYSIARCQQVVGNYPAMAPPPQCFRAHDGAALVASKLAEAGNTGSKTIAHGVVRVIVKTRVLPECIDSRRYMAIPATEPAERRNVLISDAEGGQRLQQCILIILWVCARAGHRTDVDDKRDIGALQQTDKLANWAPRVANRVEWICHRNNRIARSSPPYPPWHAGEGREQAVSHEDAATRDPCGERYDRFCRS
jgi:hypothetical protein